MQGGASGCPDLGRSGLRVVTYGAAGSASPPPWEAAGGRSQRAGIQAARSRREAATVGLGAMAELLRTKASEWRPHGPAVPGREEPWWVKPGTPPDPDGRPLPRASGCRLEAMWSSGEGTSGAPRDLGPRDPAGRPVEVAVPGGGGGLASGSSALVRSGGHADVRGSPGISRPALPSPPHYTKPPFAELGGLSPSPTRPSGSTAPAPVLPLCHGHQSPGH